MNDWTTVSACGPGAGHQHQITPWLDEYTQDPLDRQHGTLSISASFFEERGNHGCVAGKIWILSELSDISISLGISKEKKKYIRI